MSLWGNIKGKVKKLGSSSRSRSSRASSTSRDDMSVDSVRRPSQSQEEEEEAPSSPAVLRPHLKIRVLTSVDQIVVRTDYERDALELLKKQSYDHAKWFRYRIPHDDGTLPGHEPRVHGCGMVTLRRHHRTRFTPSHHGILVNTSCRNRWKRN